MFLFDEPLSNLDAALRVQTRIEIAGLHERMAETTMIYVAHDQVEAMTLADRIVVPRDGRVEQVGTPMELYSKPANRFGAQFIGSPSMNVLPAEALEGAVGPAGGHAIAVAPPKAGALQFGVRPEDLSLVEEGADCLFEGPVSLVERLGEVQLVYLEPVRGRDPLVSKLPGAVRIERGGTVRLTAPAGAVRLFDEAGLALS